MDDAPDLGVAYVDENCYICRKYQRDMKAFIIIIGIFILIMVVPAFFSDEEKAKPVKREPLFKNWQPDDTGGLPWFSHKKKARRQKKKKYFWDD